MKIASLPSLALAGAVVVAACGKGAAEPPPAEPTSATCPTTGTRECKQAADCGSQGFHCTGGRCFADQAGCPCSDVGDCGSSAHCTKGTCHPNQAGTPCTETSECGQRAHCTAGTCYANDTGSPCSSENECGPGSSCVSGTCN